MAIAAEAAIRAWINSRTDLVGEGNPLSRGAYLQSQRSPADGPYCVLIREMGTDPDIVAEPGGPQACRITAHVFAGTEQAAELAAQALLQAWQGLSGNPQPAGDTGAVILTAAGFSAPGYVPAPAEGGEMHEFQVSAALVLYEPE